MKSFISKMIAGAVALATVAFAVPLFAQASIPPAWDTTGNYSIAMNYLGSDFVHDVTLAQDATGNLTGSGTSTPYVWVITSGSVSGSTIDFHANYTATADAVTPQTTLHVTGTIATDGSISGNWSDNYQGGSRSGTWHTTSGVAHQIIRTLSYSAGAHGSITGSTTQMVLNGTDGTAVTAVPDTGYHFVNWSDALIANPRTDTGVTSNVTVTANFAADVVPTFTLTYLAGANGSLTGSTTQVVNSGANGTAVTAVPNAGYHFVNWSDASTSNPRTDTNVTANLSVTANFAADVVPTYTLTYVAGAHGSITGSTTQVVTSGANGSAVTAVADSGYHFVNWSDASTSNPRTDTGVTSNITVTANFALNDVHHPGDKNECKQGGWMTLVNRFGFHFKNQGQCVSSVVSHGHHSGHDDQGDNDQDD